MLVRVRSDKRGAKKPRAPRKKQLVPRRVLQLQNLKCF
jgi:hypothetical protein